MRFSSPTASSITSSSIGREISLTANVLASVQEATPSSRHSTVMLGSFSPTRSSPKQGGVTEIVAAFALSSSVPKLVPPSTYRLDQWVLLPIRKVYPFLERSELIDTIKVLLHVES